MLFLLAAGLTLVFGIMDMINLAHGSMYMVGAYLVASITASGSFWLGLALGVRHGRYGGAAGTHSAAPTSTSATICRRSWAPLPSC
jgi:branched-subunit amino acid ABC-type transport system permease component